MTEQILGPAAPDLSARDKQPGTTKGHIRDQAQKPAVMKAETEEGIYTFFIAGHTMKKSMGRKIRDKITQAPIFAAKSVMVNA